MDVMAYCRQVYGDAAAVSAVRTDGYSWRCTIRGREHMVDMDELCAMQHGPLYVGKLDDPRDPYNWYCGLKTADPGRPVPSGGAGSK